MKPIYWWIVYWVVVAVAIAWNFRANQLVSRQQAVCRALAADVAELEAEAAVLKDLSDQRAEAIRSASADRSLLHSMYSMCRSAEDFAPIHPDQIQVSRRGLIPNAEFLFYVPPGKHELGVRFSSIVAQAARKNRNPGSAEFWSDPQEKFIALKGGKSYRALLTFSDNGQLAQPYDRASMMRVSISENQIVEFPFQPASITHFRRYHGRLGSFSNQLCIPGQIKNSFFRELISKPSEFEEPRPEVYLAVFGRELAIPQHEDQEIRFGLFIKSEGPAKLLPTSEYLCEDIFGPFASKKSLDYLQFDKANGWYYFQSPNAVKKSNVETSKAER